VAIERWQRGGDGSGEAEGIERRGFRHVEEFLAHPTAGGDRAVGEADGLPVTDHRLAGLDILQGDFVRLGNALAGYEASGQEIARRRAFRVHQDGDIVAGVDANVHLRKSWTGGPSGYPGLSYARLRTSLTVPLCS